MAASRASTNIDEREFAESASGKMVLLGETEFRVGVRVFVLLVRPCHVATCHVRPLT